MIAGKHRGATRVTEYRIFVGYHLNAKFCFRKTNLQSRHLTLYGQQLPDKIVNSVRIGISSYPFSDIIASLPTTTQSSDTKHFSVEETCICLEQSTAKCIVKHRTSILPNAIMQVNYFFFALVYNSYYFLITCQCYHYQ